MIRIVSIFLLLIQFSIVPSSNLEKDGDVLYTLYNSLIELKADLTGPTLKYKFGQKSDIFYAFCTDNSYGPVVIIECSTTSLLPSLSPLWTSDLGCLFISLMVEPNITKAFNLARMLDDLTDSSTDDYIKNLVHMCGSVVDIETLTDRRRGRPASSYNLDRARSILFRHAYIGRLMLQKRMAADIQGEVLELSSSIENTISNPEVVTRVAECFLLFVDSIADFINLSLTCKLLYNSTRPRHLASMERVTLTARFDTLLILYHSLSGLKLMLDYFLTPDHMQISIDNRYRLMKASCLESNSKEYILGLESSLNNTVHAEIVAGFIRFLAREEAIVMKRIIKQQTFSNQPKEVSKSGRRIQDSALELTLVPRTSKRLRSVGSQDSMTTPMKSNIFPLNPLAYFVASLLHPCTYRFQPIFREVSNLLKKDPQATAPLAIVKNYATIINHGYEICDEGVMIGVPMKPFRTIRRCLKATAHIGQLDVLLLKFLENTHY